MTKIYIVIEMGWEHHANMSVHSTELQAEIEASLLNDQQTGYSYYVEDFILDES